MRRFAEADLLRLRSAFEENFSSHGEIGASVCVWQDGRELLHLHAGWRDTGRTHPWDASTLALVWSATKGPAAATALHALQEHGVDLQAPVSSIWPEFAAAGKGAVTLAQLLSHQSGLAALSDPAPSLFEVEAVAAALAAQAPFWPPGTAHGYAPRTFGYLLDAVVRRLTQLSLGSYWRQALAEPLGLEFWIGLPDGHHARAARMAPPRASELKTPDDFDRALANSATLTARAFALPRGYAAVSSLNSPEARRAEIPSFGGIGSAEALARFYHLLATGGAQDGRSFFNRQSLATMQSRLVNGRDLVLLKPTAFAAGFMLDPLDSAGRKVRGTLGPSPEAFGHPGAGGTLAFADPANRLGFAYVMNQMESGVLREAKPARLVAALYGTSPA